MQYLKKKKKNSKELYYNMQTINWSPRIDKLATKGIEKILLISASFQSKNHYT